MSMRCYLVDENMSPALANQMRRLQPTVNVIRIGDEGAPLKGTLDPEILLWLERTGYSLVTRNRKSMPQHLQAHIAAGHHVPGIFTLRPCCSLRNVV